ncbi:MAG: DUF4037 domain-containing protein [Anaerolineae bacterium]|jgi:hypothetical protein|nr:DUF4037 domain-containing protein [Anaerolineae bacterium]
MPEFMPGLELARRFFVELVQPILARDYPALVYAAALIGSGSEVLGYDTPISTDHHWGPRLLLFVSDADKLRHYQRLYTLFRERLPARFYGYPTGYTAPDAIGVRLLDEDTREGQVNHRVDILTLRELLSGELPGFDPDKPITAAQWLTFSEQRLLHLTQGAVFHDATGELTRLRARLDYYPHDVWLYLMAAMWARIAEEAPFVGRTGDVGDELGSRVIAARLVRDLMRLSFLLARVYAPYPKWFGTGFARLPVAPALLPLLEAALNAPDWPQREAALAQACHFLGEQHNQLGLTPPLPADSEPFHGRPYQVIRAERFAEALKAQIQDAEVRRIARRGLIGSIDIFSDNTDLLTSSKLRPVLRLLY